jgi:hypothetical protein
VTFYGIPPAGLRRALAPDSGSEHARAIAAAAHTWWVENRGGAGDLHVAVGALAALALAAPTTLDGPDYGPLLISLNDKELADALRAVWNSLWASRPVLAHAARPLHGWLAGPSRDDLRGLADYARVLVRAGLLEYSGDAARCGADDLLGLLVQRMRSCSQRQQRGEFFTPAGVADFHAEVAVPPGLAPGSQLLEPCAGTGTMARAAAATLRSRGLDPASYRWWLNDLDPLNAACCAVNAVLWRLGPCVMVSCGDALRHPKELEDPARRDAEQAIAEQQHRPILYPTRTRSPRWPV